VKLTRRQALAAVGSAAILKRARAAGDASAQPPRTRLSLDPGWKFFLGDPAGAESPSFDSAGWRTVETPHDWSIEGKLDAKNPTGRGAGYFPAGVGWYRRAFNVPGAWSGKQIGVEFEGVYMNATVYVNGHELGMHPYGYTPVCHNLTPHLSIGGTNTLAVRVDNAQQPNSRWYAGSGIYRHVWLHVTEPVHVAQWGVAVTTPEVSAARAKVLLKTSIANDSDQAASVRLRSIVVNQSGAVVGRAESSVQVNAEASVETPQEITVLKPALWSPESPVLYRLVTRVIRDGKTIDEVTTPFGIRSIEWSAEKGFLLNGKAVKMAGGCVHHDLGPLGVAAFDRAEERRVQILKAAGFNALRAAHNPPSPGFLDACDRLGMLVMDEAFDCWSRGKNPFDYNVAFKDWWQRDLDGMVLRDRNHPSVVCWSIGNEIPERGEPLGAQEAKMLADRVRSIDRSRPVTSALNADARIIPQWSMTDPYYSALDIGGYNYNLDSHVEDHKRVPSRIMVCTESFAHDAFEYWKMVTEFPYIIGDFVWTAADYLGESGLGRSFLRDRPKAGERPRMRFGGGFPNHGADGGDVDKCGFRKAPSHYRNIVWDRGEKLYMGVRQPVPEGKEMVVNVWGSWPVFQSWNWPGMEGKPIDVEIYSRADAVRLYLNGRPVAQAPITRAERFKATIPVNYAPGELKAVALKAGKPIAECVLRTVGEPVRVRLTPDRTQLRANGQDLSFITVEVVDRAGQPHPNAEHPVTFALKGPGSIIAVGNADMMSEEPYQGSQRKLSHGRALVVLRSSRTAGALRLTATAPGLKEAAIQIVAGAPGQ
jgi:beta-galactosidase